MYCFYEQPEKNPETINPDSMAKRAGKDLRVRQNKQI